MGLFYKKKSNKNLASYQGGGTAGTGTDVKAPGMSADAKAGLIGAGLNMAGSLGSALLNANKKDKRNPQDELNSMEDRKNYYEQKAASDSNKVGQTMQQSLMNAKAAKGAFDKAGAMPPAQGAAQAAQGVAQAAPAPAAPQMGGQMAAPTMGGAVQMPGKGAMPAGPMKWQGGASMAPQPGVAPTLLGAQKKFF